MTSSKYIQLTDKILMEYEYFNEAESSSYEKKEYQIPVSAYIYTHVNGTKYLVSQNITKNKEEESWVDDYLYCLEKASPKRYVSRNGNSSHLYVSAKDYMEDDTDEYASEWKEQKTINCDKIKIYFAASYDSSKNADGLYTITISANYKSNNEIYPFILANYILGAIEPVPTPFLIGEKLYTRVVEFYVPSIRYNTTLFDTIELYTPTKIDIKCSKITKEISSSFKNKNIDLLSLVEISSVSISPIDQYATIIASIEEIDDYFKLEGATKNTWKTFSDFISDLPGTADDYILMHDITVNELLANNNTEFPTSNWQITTHNVITQTDDFDEPVLFRPVIKYSNCIACVLDYTLRIYCQTNNTQIIKRATYQNFNFSKYGKKMIKINLGTSPAQINIYNKIDNNKVSDLTLINTNSDINISAQEKIFKTSYITSFRDRMNVKASIAPVKIDNIE